MTGPRPIEEAIIHLRRRRCEGYQPNDDGIKIVGGLYFAVRSSTPMHIRADSICRSPGAQRMPPPAISRLIHEGSLMPPEEEYLKGISQGMEKRSIAIDGPSGAGKSTLARMTAKEYGLIYVDTGALYRSVGHFVHQNGVMSKDEEKIAGLLPKIRIEMRYDEDGLQRTFLNGEDVADAIRLPQASIYASDVSAMAPVRDFCCPCSGKWRKITMLSWMAGTSARL